MTSPAITFDFALWIGRYPEFAALTEQQAQGYFDEAGLYCANDSCNPAFGDGILPTLLNMLTAHIAWLYAPRDANGNPSSSGVASSPLVGRVSGATEGSVGVSTQNDYEVGTPQWYQQTRYGSSYWAATEPYRTARYSARPTIVPTAIYPTRWLT